MTADRTKNHAGSVSTPAGTTEDASLPEALAREARSGRLVIAHAPDPAQVGQVIELTDELQVLGREVAAHGVQIEDRRMSRVHARVMFDRRAGMVRIGDAESRNGTFVDGQAVDTVLLSHGAVVRMGDSVLVYMDGDPMAAVHVQLERFAPTGLSMLLRGETGVGKEVLACSIHARSARKGPLVAINCAGIPKELIAAELFGHTKQAFSGAREARKGVIAAADHGTLLLDEIGECPQEAQAALLRVLQEKAVRPVGAEHELPIDLRVLAATNADLEHAVATGAFRADLYARLAQVVVTVPPLRARKAELLSIAQELARAYAPARGSALSWSTDAAEALLLWHWPLNVRELQSLVNAALTVAEHAVVDHAVVDEGKELKLDLAALGELAPAIAAPLQARKRGGAVRVGEGELAALRKSGAAGSTLSPPAGGANPRSQLRALLETQGGNVAAVAQALGKPRAQVYRWMRSMGLSAESFRKPR